MSQSLAAAENIINEYEQTTLSQADWELFLDALENPPTKYAKLKEALALHKKSVVQIDEVKDRSAQHWSPTQTI